MRLALIVIVTTWLAACGGDTCDPSSADGACGDDQTCVFTEGKRYTCESLCQADTQCTEGTCDGRGTSCPSCQDVVNYCE